MSLERTPDGKWVLYDVSTGHRLERWSVDAREMIERGGYTVTRPEHTTDAPRGADGDSPAVPVAPTLPHEHSPGVPLIATREATPAKPSVPVRSSRGKR